MNFNANWIKPPQSALRSTEIPECTQSLSITFDKDDDEDDDDDDWDDDDDDDDDD